MADITTAMVTAFQTLASSALTAIGDILPVILPVMGAVVVIGIGVSLFKRFVH